MSASAHDPCVDPAVLGAVLDGSLPAERVASVTRHLSRCAECRSLLERAAEVEHDVAKSRAHLVKWLSVAAMLAVVGIYPFFFRNQQRVPVDPIDRLIKESPRTARTLEPRLSGGFPWAPFNSVKRTPGDQKTPEQLQASGVAAAVLREIGNSRTPRALHAAGVAYLVAGDAETALPLLEEASRAAPGDARIWNDLAAASYAAAKLDDPRALQRALDAANHAIHLSPGMVEPYFNRALILERIGLPREAVAAWNEYLQRDPNGKWPGEARGRVANLAGAQE